MERVDLSPSCEVTFFVPCLNEERHIVPSVETIVAAAARCGITYEIIVVDDHSTDRTVEVLEAWMRAHPEVPLLLKRKERTRGLAYNYVDAAFLGRGKYYKLVCGDDAEPLESMLAVLEARGRADMVLPYFPEDPRGFGRLLLSRLFTFLVNTLSGYRLRYYNGTALHLRYDILRWHSDSQGFAYHAEIVTQLLDEGATCVEVPFRNVEQTGRKSKALHLQNFLSVTHSLLQIFLRRVRRYLFHS